MDNLHTVKGVIFSKDVKTGPSKKVGEPDWQLCIMKIEAVVDVSGKDITSVCEFVFDWGVSFDEYATNDHIEAEFYFKNRSIKTKAGTMWEKEEKRIVWMKHADITTPPPPRKSDKVNVGSMTNPKELTNPTPAPKADVFDNPRPSDMMVKDDDYDDQLPF